MGNLNDLGKVYESDLLPDFPVSLQKPEMVS